MGQANGLLSGAGRAATCEWLTAGAGAEAVNAAPPHSVRVRTGLAEDLRASLIAERPAGLRRSLGRGLVAEIGRAGHAASGCRLWVPADRRQLSGPDRASVGDGYLRFKTMLDMQGDRIDVASALAELTGWTRLGGSKARTKGDQKAG